MNTPMKTRRTEILTLAILSKMIKKNPNVTKENALKGGVIYIPSEFIGRVAQIEITETIVNYVKIQ